ncbi:Glutamate receptor, ionotropic kainate 2 [Papilio machaon]|uniref:Glutamate receptor, ionotropic kainate 2 n=1 Tax=Papilio machaon TaxID=76193 RepID=A0A194RR85_PAPMA|nr:Glutamate receptor, ionotropic kainate 2 [Papilio machaon]
MGYEYAPCYANYDPLQKTTTETLQELKRAIFDDGSFLYEAAFNVAIEAASENQENPFVPNVIRTSPGDVVEAETAVCSLLESNVFGVFGPIHRSSLQHVQSIADYLELPQIITEFIEAQNRNWSAINLYPSHIAYSQVFADIIKMKGWTDFTIIYEGAELLPFLNNILTMQNLVTDENIRMTVVQLPDGDDYRIQLKSIKMSGSVNYLVISGKENLAEILLQAQQVGIMSDKHSYIIMNPDFHTIDIELFKHGGSNITGVRFFDQSSENIQNFIKSLNEQVTDLSEGKIENAVPESALSFNLALVYDAVSLYTTALKTIGLEEGSNITCEYQDTWNFGSSIINFVRTMEIDGMTGVIKFDEDGLRSDFEVDVLEVMSHGFEKSAPYGMLRESSNKLEGNNRYEGFGIEVIEELAKMNEFNYTFDIQADGVYGSYDSKTKKWTGMMEKIMDGVWGWLAGAYVGVSVLLFILGRFAPEEWQNPYPCIEEPETLDNQFTLANAFWFTLGSVLTQGSEIAPIAVSTRMAGSMWWFFTLIMVSSYTANLAAFLTVESKFYAIKSVSDLASNPYGITYGAKKGGATFSFFKESDNLLYQKMYHYMDEHPELMTSTNDEGLLRVKSEKENYAFLMESTSIEYMVERNCDVAQVGGLLDNKGYGIAMKKNSPYRQPMSESILQLQEEGKLARMKDKWWKEKRGGGACADDDASSGDAQPLVLANVGGVFIVLVAGSALAVVCAFIEMIFDVWMISRTHKVSFKDELIAELKFILSFSGDTKPVRHRESTGSKSPKRDDDDDKSGDVEFTGDDNRPDHAPTPRSERSSHSNHNAHSRRQSNAIQIARMRKFT